MKSPKQTRQSDLRVVHNAFVSPRTELELLEGIMDELVKIDIELDQFALSEDLDSRCKKGDP